MRLDYTYVCATEFARAITWYRDVLFKANPVLVTDRLAYWKVGETHFGVFDPSVSGERVTFGNNVVPNFVVDDVDALHDRLRDSTRIAMPVQSVNGTRLFRCRDSEGNLLEFFQWEGG